MRDLGRRHRRRLPRIAALAGILVTAGLALLHGRLLWQRVADGSLLEPPVAARWIASALLAVAMLWLWSRDLSLLSGRRAAVVWLAVLLVHVGVPGGSLPAIAPAAPALLAVPALLALVALFGLRLAAGHATRTPLVRGAIVSRRPRRTPAGWSATLYSRPPPVPLPC